MTVLISVLFIIAIIFAFTVGVIFESLLRKRREERKTEIVSPKVERTLSSIKRRAAFEALAGQDGLEGIIMDVDEFDQLVTMDEDEQNIFFERQSRFFLECALNLMAHSYLDLSKARFDALNMLELAFEEDVVEKFSDKRGDENV